MSTDQGIDNGEHLATVRLGGDVAVTDGGDDGDSEEQGVREEPSGVGEEEGMEKNKEKVKRKARRKFKKK